VADPTLLDDVERTIHEFDPLDAELTRVELAADDERARPDQDRFEGVLEVAVDERATAVAGPSPAVAVDPSSVSVRGACPNQGNGVVQVAVHGSDELPVDTIIHSSVRVGDASETHVDPRTGEPRLRVTDVDGDGYDDLVVHVRMRETGLTCANLTSGVTARFKVGGVARAWAGPRDLSGATGISFWYEGTGSGEERTFRLRDNRAADPGPDGWELLWSDEFDGPAGSPPDPANWTPEIGDGTVNQIPGWGNDELQYYTDDPANVRHDGDGHLVIEVHEVEEPSPETGLQCYYGPCEYTSARLLTWHKQEFEYGRIEARVKVPAGAGYWPAFWSLGTDIDEVPWPRAGEIDIMEFVGREPYEVFGTIHGPGYSGGQSYGNTISTEDAVPEEFHTYAIEWGPGQIVWEFDGQRYHEAVPADVAPNEWVFDKPFFLLLNVAVGGNFGGPVAADTVFPQQMLVDHVRVWGAPDTAERFEATFVDEVDGWQQVSIPFDELTRSADQPEGASDDGLTLTEAWGYEVLAPAGTTFRLDDVRLRLPGRSWSRRRLTAGPGTLRSALAGVAAGGTITIDPARGRDGRAGLAVGGDPDGDDRHLRSARLHGGRRRQLAGARGRHRPARDLARWDRHRRESRDPGRRGPGRRALRLEDVTVVDNRTTGPDPDDFTTAAARSTSRRRRLDVVRDQTRGQHVGLGRWHAVGRRRLEVTITTAR
jgi:beta-glucanase (GH16 family)